MRLRVAKKIIFGGRERYTFEGERLVSLCTVYSKTEREMARRRWLKWRRRHPYRWLSVQWERPVAGKAL